MIQPGAPAVDGWAEQNNFAALMCAGNLALREMVESIRDDPEVRLLVVDRSRTDARVPLFYPDLAAQAEPRCQLTLSLRQFLVEQTGDPHWPHLVDERVLSQWIVAHVPGILQAHSH